jgi:hypothetical protein
MGDNRGTPEKPKTNLRAPDWKCKSKDCDGVRWPPKEDTQERQLQVQGEGGMTAPTGPTLDFTQIGPAIMSRAAAIAADVMANGGTINPAQALAAAYHFEETGEVIGRHAYVGTTGQVSGKVLEGYRGVARDLDMSRYQVRYRPLTDDEKLWHEIDPTWMALACECDVLKARSQCIRMGIPYTPMVGIGIVKPADKLTAQGKPKDPPKTKTWYWVLQKRARVDVLRQLGENTSADEVLDEAGIEAPAGYITIEQAEALVHERERATQQPAITPAEQQAAFQARVTAMRGDPGQNPYDDPEPPSDAEFRKLTSATEERTQGKLPSAPATAPKLASNRAVLLYAPKADAFAKEFPDYQTKTGTFDDGHIRASIAHLGYTEITPANIEEAFGKLAEHALSALADAAAVNAGK